MESRWLFVHFFPVCYSHGGNTAGTSLLGGGMEGEIYGILEGETIRVGEWKLKQVTILCKTSVRIFLLKIEENHVAHL